MCEPAHRVEPDRQRAQVMPVTAHAAVIMLRIAPGSRARWLLRGRAAWAAYPYRKRALASVPLDWARPLRFLGNAAFA